MVCRRLAGRGSCYGDIWLCGMPVVPSVAFHPKTNLLYVQAELPQEAWLHKEAPWARESLQPEASPSAVGRAAGP